MAAASASFLLGKGLLVIWGDVDTTTTDEEALNDWWTNEHLPERLSITGFLRARRYYVADNASPSVSKYLVCYEVSSLDTLTSDEYMAKLNSPTPGTAKYMPLLFGMDRSPCSIVLSAGRSEFANCKAGAVGATMVHIVLSFPALSGAKEQELTDWLRNTFAPAVLQSHHSVLAFHVVKPEEGARKAGYSSKSYEGVRLAQQSDDPASEERSKLILLIEFSYTRSAVMNKSRSPMLKAQMVEHLQNYFAGKMESNQLYELLCVANE